MTETNTVLPEDPTALATLIDQAMVKFASLPLTAATEDVLLSVADSLERSRRRFDGVDASLMVEISDRGAFSKAGYFSLHAFLAGELRLGDGEAKRRRIAIAALGRFSNLQGQTLDPALPATAAAVAEGVIGGDHAREIDAIMDKIPAAIGPDVRTDAEAQLALVARDLTPQGVRAVGNRLLAHLDPDGTLTEDRDRQRRRGLTLMPQDRQLMSKVRAQLTPALRAQIEVVLQSWAVPGMNNPDDPDSPSGAVEAADQAAVAAAAERDDRCPAQRNHDALEAMLVFVRTHAGSTGSTSLKSELVVTITDKELAARAGVAVTATGTRLPVSDLVRVAAAATPHLAVFSHATNEVLYLGRGQRSASKAQRLALFARDRGCTAPGCGVPFARTEAHHFPDWQDGGLTDIDHLGAACGRHNRAVGAKLGDWETMILIDGPHAGRVAWRPVTQGKGRDWRVNHIHHAELLPDQGPHAPPDPKGSRVEAYLAKLVA